MNICLSILKLSYIQINRERETLILIGILKGVYEVCKDYWGGGEIHAVESLVVHDDEYTASYSDTASPSKTSHSQVIRRMHGHQRWSASIPTSKETLAI
jgi:hypothetical protein